MLSKIRKNLRAFSLPLWIVAASFVGTIFLVWGKGSVSGPSGNEVATVNGKGITLGDFNREYQSVVFTLKERFGENFRKFVKEDDIRRMALNRLITKELLLQLAEEEGLKVSDWAVAKYIEGIPAFQENGKFSVELYGRFLESRHMTPSAFEDSVRKELLVQKLLKVVDNAPSVTEFELKELYRKFFGKREFKYKLFNLKDFNPQVSEKEVKDFYQKNRSLFEESGKESYYVLRFPKSKEGEKKAEEAFKLAKEGKFKELLKFNPKKLKDEKLKRELDKRPFVFKSEDELILAFKEKERRVQPLEEVRKSIVKYLKEQKAKELAAKAAKEYKGELKEKVAPVDLAQFTEKFKPVKPPVELFQESPVGSRAVLELEGGYGVFSPVTELKVDKFEREKEERLKDFILRAKRDTDYANLINLLRQKATVKVNNSLFRSVQ